MEQTDPAPGLPSRLVIDAREPLERFQKVVEQMQDFGVELNAVLADLISCLQMKEDAPYELAHSGYEMLPASMPICDAGQEPTTTVTMSQEDKEVVEYVDAREELGKALLKLFMDFKLYNHGRLFYQINTVLGTALVLDKIGVPFLAQDRQRLRYVNNIDQRIARQLDLSARRNRQENVPQRPAELFHGLSPQDQARFRAFAALMGGPRRTD